MMGRLKSDQGQLFYEFHLGYAVPEDHLGAEDGCCSANIAGTDANLGNAPYGAIRHCFAKVWPDRKAARSWS